MYVHFQLYIGLKYLFGGLVMIPSDFYFSNLSHLIIPSLYLIHYYITSGSKNTTTHVISSMTLVCYHFFLALSTIFYAAF